ncbi:hypothetical protein [Egbenema bharatensis]|uniref:hypothetical protein n=1 Tax=Egbenema bharatensis TaxID=3463334 RepID=UPI003A899F2C
MRTKNQATIPDWLKWFTLGLVIFASVAVIIVSVRLTPASNQVGQIDSEVLARQLEFILRMNSAFLGFLGIIGALLVWFFKNNLEDAKVVASTMVREELDRHIQAKIQEEFRFWELSLRTERVIGQTLVDYYLPNGSQEPPEFFLVRNRGFRQVSFCSRLREVRRSETASDVVIFDAQNWENDQGERVVKLTEKGWLVDESEKQVKQQIDELRKILPNYAVLVVYVRGIVGYLNDPKFESVYVLPANNQVTLLGHAANGAFVASADRNPSRSQY